MMNQKFSQLNRDYVKTVSKKRDALAKESMRTGIGWALLGALTAGILIAVFYVAKPAVKKVETVASPRVSVEKPKPVKVKHKKPKVVAKEEQEYGFYTMLPKMEVKAARHEGE
jgi:hypothetical protein